MSNDLEHPDMWWLYKEEDRIGTAGYVRILDSVKAGDENALEQYYKDVMHQFEFREVTS